VATKPVPPVQRPGMARTPSEREHADLRTQCKALELGRHQGRGGAIQGQKIQQALGGRLSRCDPQLFDCVTGRVSAQNILKLSAAGNGEAHESSKLNGEKVATGSDQ
jgi:hypothetical protein